MHSKRQIGHERFFLRLLLWDGKICMVVFFCYIIKEFGECFSRFTIKEQEYLHRLFIQVLLCCFCMFSLTLTRKLRWKQISIIWTNWRSWISVNTILGRFLVSIILKFFAYANFVLSSMASCMNLLYIVSNSHMFLLLLVSLDIGIMDFGVHQTFRL